MLSGVGTRGNIKIQLDLKRSTSNSIHEGLGIYECNQKYSIPFTNSKCKNLPTFRNRPRPPQDKQLEKAVGKPDPLKRLRITAKNWRGLKAIFIGSVRNRACFILVICGVSPLPPRPGWSNQHVETTLASTTSVWCPSVGGLKTNLRKVFFGAAKQQGTELGRLNTKMYMPTFELSVVLICGPTHDATARAPGTD